MGNCPWSIRWGTTAETTTKCDLASHTSSDSTDPAYHEGRGLFAHQRIRWMHGDRREYQGEWPGYCTKLGGSAFHGGCTLPAGHHGRCAP